MERNLGIPFHDGHGNWELVHRPCSRLMLQLTTAEEQTALQQLPRVRDQRR
jgi:hypothetical protein